MNFSSQSFSYASTGFFGKMVLDYIDQAPAIQPFYNHPVSFEGIKAAITERKKIATDRSLLVSVLNQQYANIEKTELVANNIQSLLNDDTFTVCTAHQPNIFTGPLYFIYKILHAVKLAEELKAQFPENNFVPVYYMGSEDADLEELGHVFVNGDKHEWKTNQTGAVGRMVVDKELVKMLDILNGQLSIYPHGTEIIEVMKQCYKVGVTIEQATFQLVNILFSAYGVVTLLPDNARLKAAFIPVIQKELIEAFSHPAVAETVAAFPANYKIQASGRDLNMFYLLNDKRERIELNDGVWSVLNTDLKFNKEQILAELNANPERFSPNVILRPVFQEYILPNIAFIGGGGEIAYWLQLKKVFNLVDTPYPMLIVRNSFLYIQNEMEAGINKLKLSHSDLFKPELELINQVVKRDSLVQVTLDNERLQMNAIYEQLKTITANIDSTLKVHTAALQTQALHKIAALEKKMLRAEKKKFEAQSRQIHTIKNQLFPNNNLQERVDNLMLYYAKWSKEFISMIYDNSTGLNQQMGIIVQHEKTEEN